MASTKPSTPPTFTPWDAETHRDPYPQLRALQEHDPVHRFDLVSGWVVTSHADAVRILEDGSFSSRIRTSTFEQTRAAPVSPEDGADVPLRSFFERSLLFLDDPRHASVRRCVAAVFTPGAVARRESRIRQIVEATVAALPTEREFDFVKELAARVPAAVIADILGVPSSDVDRHLHWSEGIGIFLDIVKSEEQRAHATRCLGEMWDYFDRATAAPSSLPEDALMGCLAALCERSEMTREEMLAMCCLLSAAGQETTANLLANAMCALLERPELADRLRQDEPSLPTFVEEVLRTDGPIMGVPRVATQDVCLRDRQVRAGDYLIVVTAAANRDPARYDAPDDLTVDGPARPHLAFGQGRHYCLGAALARAEAVAVLSCCLRQRRFEPARPLAEIRRKPTQVLRGPAELWVRAPVRSAPGAAIDARQGVGGPEMSGSSFTSSDRSR